ncbi:DcrB-related protein [Massilia mucilaginosa]|nr:DcrB-related protein [Massilia mucilaginosa]
MPYHTNHATFELPAQLKDKTMHMFTLADEGPSEFSVVMSHADAQGDDSLVNFADRLVAELGNSLPDFRLLNRVERTLDETPAIELAYRWRSAGHLMHQRQVITMLPRTEAGDVKAMLIAATCLTQFTDEWNATFDGMLASVKLRHKKAPEVKEVASSAPAIASTVFALSERRRTLHAFANHDEACRKTDAREVEHDAWAFFDAAGTPLHPDFVVPNTGTVWRKAGSYVLEKRPERGTPNLRAQLYQASMFVAGSPAVRLSSIAEVQAMLDQSVEG